MAAVALLSSVVLIAGCTLSGLSAPLTVSSSVVAAADGQSAASPTALPTTLPIIGRSRSKRFCTLEEDRTNGAITVALVNDKIVASGIGHLRAANLDRFELTVIGREKTMHDLRAIAAALQTNVAKGATQVADLRALATREPDAARSPELRLLADKIDDTLERQRTIGSDLAKMLTIVDGRYAAGEGATLAAGVMPETADAHVRGGLLSIDERAAREPLNRLFGDVADEFADRTIAIGHSEDAAAVHAPKAIAGC